MYSKEITFEDFNENEVTQTFYFHISEAEMMDKEFNFEGGSWSEFLQKLVEEEDSGQLYRQFEKFIQMAYGHKSDDGLRFEKDPESTKKFTQHAAYGDIVSSILGTPGEMAVFVNSVFPKSVRTKTAALEGKLGKPITEATRDELIGLIESTETEAVVPQDQDKPVGPPPYQLPNQ